jgi:hypothetical protein
VLQLELFPRTELRSLSDFQKLEQNRLSVADRRRLVAHPDFFKSPKANELIRRHHARLVDSILGLRVQYVEEMLVAQARNFDPEGCHESWGPELHQGVQTWVGLELETLQTPYAECYRILQLLKIRPYQHVVDLGAAYGRMGVVLGGLFIKNTFTGLEYVKARVEEGNRLYQELGLARCQLVEQDLAADNFALPEADIYFLYDFGQVEHIERTLRQLEQVSRLRPIKLVVRGKFTRQIIEHRHPWLQLQYQGRGEEFFSIYWAFHVATDPGF